MTVRTRFAPSPTGYLHVGGVRTALFSYLFARKNGGEFVLRIEDTDRVRSTQASVDAILDGMRWLGLEADEGPVFQTQRRERYLEVAEELLATDQAYHCYCSAERLEQMRAAQMARGEKARYDGRCRNGREPVRGVSPVIRFRNPESGSVLIDDQVQGPIRIQNEELDDLIIVRSDGTPTYNLSVVVDDLDMGMTHVIRGDDHINNTPRQLNLISALGKDAPAYAHVPMILGEDGSRLSKRHGAVSVLAFREMGILPEALLNYLVRLGWSDGDRELFTLDEMVERFDVAGINKSAARFDQTKLLWFNQHYIQTADPERVADELVWHYQHLGVAISDGPPVEKVVLALRERARTVLEMAQASRWAYEDFEQIEPTAAKKHLRGVALEPLTAVYEALDALESWQADTIDAAIMATVQSLDIGFGKVGLPLRVAVTGNTSSPGLGATLSLVGRKRTRERLTSAMDFVRQRISAA
ncbi:MAG: glutamate--tRNA ligase [Pseudomonadota bacterium]